KRGQWKCRLPTRHCDRRQAAVARRPMTIGRVVVGWAEAAKALCCWRDFVLTFCPRGPSARILKRSRAAWAEAREAGASSDGLCAAPLPIQQATWARPSTII